MIERGRSLIDNLYGTMLGLLWPLIFYSRKGSDIENHTLGWNTYFLIVFSYIYICDDYFCCQKVLGAKKLGVNEWRNSLRFWLDIVILLLMNGFALSLFYDSNPIYFIIVVVYLSLKWCNLLIDDFKESLNPDELNTCVEFKYCRYLRRQQLAYLWGIGLFGISCIFRTLMIGFEKYPDHFGIKIDSITECYRIATDTDLLILLWLLMMTHFLTRGVYSAIFEVKGTNILNIWFFFFRHFNKSFFRKTVVKFMNNIRHNKGLYFLLISLFLSIGTGHQAVFFIALLMFCWLFFELIAADGICYQAYLAKAVKIQAGEDEEIMIETFNFMEEVGIKDE